MFLTLFIGIAIGGLCVFFFFRQSEKPESKYARMSGPALRDRYKECQSEMSFWTKVLTTDIQSVGLMDRVGHVWFSDVCVILKLKKIAVWRIDALEDIMEEIAAQEYLISQSTINVVTDQPWNVLPNIHPNTHPAT